MENPMMFATLAAVAMPLATLTPVTTAAIAKPPLVTVVTIHMAHRAFRPQVIRLKGGQLYRLRFVNTDRTEHDFTAPDFLAQARLAAGQRLDGGRLNVRSGETRSLTLAPAPGRYEAKSSKALDVVSNMKAQILVY